MFKEKIILRLDQPVEGIKRSAYVLLKDADNKVLNANERKTTFIWYRSGQKKTCQNSSCVKGSIKDVPATLQNIFSRKSYCCNKCFTTGWTKEKSVAPQQMVKGLKDIKDFPSRVSELFQQEEETWNKVGEGRGYQPTAEDVGHVLKVECTVYLHGAQDVLATASTTTNVVVAFPKPPMPRRLKLNPHKSERSFVDGDTGLRVVSYNILASCYATKQMYPYCPMWCLSWQVRKAMIVRELIQYNADVICLQEVEEKAFVNFFAQTLREKGYEGSFKAKTRTATPVDGCAIFYRKKRLKLLESETIEFNSIAHAVAESGVFKQHDVDAVLKRLLRDTVAQLLLFETIGSPATQKTTPRKLLCVANTHLFWDPEFADVKLWQVHMLVKDIEGFINAHGQNHRANIPLVLCGDFNSKPSSPVCSLLRNEPIDTTFDPLGILPSVNTMGNTLDLQDAYDSMDACPAFTNYTAGFQGVLDHIWISRSLVKPVSCLLVPDEKTLRGRRDTPLPNTVYPSDHIALCVDLVIPARTVAEYRY